VRLEGGRKRREQNCRFYDRAMSGKFPVSSAPSIIDSAKADTNREEGCMIGEKLQIFSNKEMIRRNQTVGLGVSLACSKRRCD
jgi:hypothetical protein